MFPYSTDTSNYYQYFLSDHLGNTRVAFDTPHDTLKVKQRDDYLPFGMEISQGNVANPKMHFMEPFTFCASFSGFLRQSLILY